MTHTVFLTLLNMGITAGYVALAVILARLLLKKASRRITCALWGLVGLRLVCPFSLKSVFSLIPSASPIPTEIELSPSPAIQSGIPFVNETINPSLSQSMSPGIGDSINPLQIVIGVAMWIWVMGMFAMLCYLLITTLRLRHKLREAVCLRDNIYLCDRIDTPFIFGIFRPKIYMPSHLDKAVASCVIAHEQAHIKRLDHLWKPLGFLLLSVYWFHPLLWISYLLFCRDIEFACDETVIRRMGVEQIKEYSAALLNCSVRRPSVTACPLAFGEVGVKGRIKAVLNYNKPAFWLMLVALLVSIGVALCFLTDPKDPTSSAIIGGADSPTNITVSTSSQTVETHYRAALHHYQQNPAIHRNPGELQPETTEIIQMDDGKYYQSYASNNANQRYVFVSHTEADLGDALWDFVLAGTVDAYSAQNIGKLQNDQKGNPTQTTVGIVTSVSGIGFTMKDGTNTEWVVFTKDLPPESIPYMTFDTYVEVLYDGVVSTYNGRLAIVSPIRITAPNQQKIPPVNERGRITFRLGDNYGNDAFINTSHIAFAIAGYNQSEQRYTVQLFLTDEGTRIFADVTAQNLGNTLSIWEGKTLLTSATVVDAVTDGQVIISGDAITQEYANQLAYRINQHIAAL